MSKQRPRSRGRQPKGGSGHSYPRTARLSEVLREVIADELTRIDDERLSMVTITNIEVDPEMNRAIVRYDSLLGEDGFTRLAQINHAHAVQLSEKLGAVKGVSLVNDVFFNEFTLKLPRPASAVVERIDAALPAVRKRDGQRLEIGFGAGETGKADHGQGARAARPIGPHMQLESVGRGQEQALRAAVLVRQDLVRHEVECPRRKVQLVRRPRRRSASISSFELPPKRTR